MFNELSLEAHHSKSGNLVCGDQEWVRKKKYKLESDPAMIQDFKVKVANSKKYLGMKIVFRIIPDIIEANTKMQAGKVHTVATKVQNDIHEKRMKRIEAAATQIQSEIIPVFSARL